MRLVEVKEELRRTRIESKRYTGVRQDSARAGGKGEQRHWRLRLRHVTKSWGCALAWPVRTTVGDRMTAWQMPPPSCFGGEKIAITDRQRWHRQ